MKNFVFILEEGLWFTKNLFCLERSRISKRSYSTGFIVFLWTFAHKFFLEMPTEKFEENRTFSEWLDLKKTMVHASRNLGFPIFLINTA